MAKASDSVKSKSEPRIVGFICNWSAYSGLEIAGMHRIKYASNVHLIKVMCLGRVHSGLVLKAFELGTGGVMLLGCSSGNCQYEFGIDRTKESFSQMRDMLDLLGIGSQRLLLVEVGLGEGAFLARKINAFARRIKKLGPSPIDHKAQPVESGEAPKVPILL